jgi:hypothetical protein
MNLTNEQVKELMMLWGRNQINKYKIIQKLRKDAEEMDISKYPILREFWRKIMNLADELEKTI